MGRHSGYWQKWLSGLAALLLLGGLTASAAAQTNRATSRTTLPASSRRTMASSTTAGLTVRTANLQAPAAAPTTAPVEPPEPPAGGEEVAPLPAERGALTLVDLEQFALSYHPALAEYQAKVDAARGEWLQVGLYPNPLVGYSGQQVGSHGVAEQDGVLVQGELVSGGKLRLNRAVATHQIASAEMALATQQLKVLTAVRKSFYEVLVAQQRRELADQLVAIGTQGRQVAETLFQAKEVGRADVLQARVEADQARLLLVNAQNRLAAAWRELAAASGNAAFTPQPLTGDIHHVAQDYDWEGMLGRVLGSSPELAVALADAERARARVDRARVEYLPNFTIQGIVQRDAAIRSTDGAVQVTFPIPVFNRNQGGVRQAEGEWIAAENAVQRLELDLQRRLAPVFERYLNARRQVTSYEEEIVPNAKENLELVRASYQAGEVGYINLLTAQRTFFHTNLAYLDSLRELWTAVWDLEGLVVID